MVTYAEGTCSGRVLNSVQLYDHLVGLVRLTSWCVQCGWTRFLYGFWVGTIIRVPRYTNRTNCCGLRPEAQ